MASLGPAQASGAVVDLGDSNLHPGWRATFPGHLKHGLDGRSLDSCSTFTRICYINWGLSARMEAGKSQRDVFPFLCRQPLGSWRNESVVSSSSPGSGSPILSPELAYQEGMLGTKVSASGHGPYASCPVPFYNAPARGSFRLRLRSGWTLLPSAFPLASLFL